MTNSNVTRVAIASLPSFRSSLPLPNFLNNPSPSAHMRAQISSKILWTSKQP